MKFLYPVIKKTVKGVAEAAIPELGKAAGKAIAGVAGALAVVTVDGIKVVGGAAVESVKTGINLAAGGANVVGETAVGVVNYAYNSGIGLLGVRERNMKRSMSKRNTLARAHNKNFDELIKELEEYIGKKLIKITDQQLEVIFKYSDTSKSEDTQSTKQVLKNEPDEYIRAKSILDYIKDEGHKKGHEEAHVRNGFYGDILDLWIEKKIFQEYFIKTTEKTEDFSMEICEENLQSACKP